MAELIKISNEISFTANVLVKEEDNMYIAHCLELDIVAVGSTLEETQREIVSLICAQIDYAFSNDNIENLYHPAPAEVWQEFLSCKEQIERKYAIRSGFKDETNLKNMIPPWLITKTCSSAPKHCYA